MKQHENDMRDFIEEALSQHSTSVSFDSVWDKSNSMGNKKILRHKKLIAVPLLSMITCLALFTIGFAAYNIYRNIDKTDYPFIDDSAVIGKWEAVDFVTNIEDFMPENKSCDRELFLNSMVFMNQGKMLNAIENDILAPTGITWTKGLIINKNEKTASKYKIKEINGNLYMFYEWKSGDYIFRNVQPYYYVLKKVDSKDYSDYQVKQVKEDKIDYPFVDDPQIKGKWRSVDFVENINEFKPQEKCWLDELYLKELNFEKKGKLIIANTIGSFHSTWTKDLVIDQECKTASKCEIKEIDGKEYMFFEWKSGDYIYRGMKPRYYVLERVE